MIGIPVTGAAVTMSRIPITGAIPTIGIAPFPGAAAAVATTTMVTGIWSGILIIGGVPALGAAAAVAGADDWYDGDSNLHSTTPTPG